MDDIWFEVLVVILSICLAFYLVLSIVLIVKLIKISNNIKRITEHAEQVADRAEHISEFFEKTAAPVAIAKLIANLSETFKGKSKKGKK